MKYWKIVAEKIDARVLRERVLIGAALIVLIYLFWQLMVASPLEKRELLLKNELATINSEQQQTELQISTLKMAAASELYQVKKVEIAKLEQQILAADERLKGLSQGLISVDQLPKVLEDMLLQSAQLRLLKVQTLPATELQLNTTITEPDGKTSLALKGTGVFKHGVVLELAGGYQELLALLSAIEALQWRFYWESLDYEVLQYPNAHIELRVFTLSSEEGLLGV